MSTIREEGGVKVIRFLRKPGEGWPQAAEVLSAVLEAAQDAVLVGEEGAGLIYANQAAVKLLGYKIGRASCRERV